MIGPQLSSVCVRAIGVVVAQALHRRTLKRPASRCCEVNRPYKGRPISASRGNRLKAVGEPGSCVPFGTRRRVYTRRSVAVLLGGALVVFVDYVLVGVEAEVVVLEAVGARWE